MKKHLVFKAFILLVVMFFHSFVLVPKAHSYSPLLNQVITQTVLYGAGRGIAPSVIMASPSNWGFVLGYAAVSGIAYMAVKSGAITEIKNWIDTYISPLSPVDGYIGPIKVVGGNNRTYRIYYSSGYGGWRAELRGANGEYIGGATYGTYASSSAAFQGVYGYAYVRPAIPSTPTDYSSQLASNQPAIPANTVYMTPGGMLALNGNNVVNNYTAMSDSDIDKLVSALNMTTPDYDTDVQPAPNLGDNTLSADANASIPYLQQIGSYVSNLIGIKSDTGFIKTNTDNLVSGQLAQTSAINNQLGKLDNIAVLSQAQKNTMDNVAVSINNQTAIQQQSLGKLDNVATKTGELEDEVSNMSATSGTVQTRIQSLRDLAATKFPFSLAISLSVSAVSGASTYDFDPLPLTPTISIPINPMAGPLAGVFTWARQLLVWFLWAGTLFAMLKRGMQM